MSVLKLKIQSHDQKKLITRCMGCDTLIESVKAPERCPKCHKTFLPQGYLRHKNLSEKELKALYVASHEIEEEDIVVGVTVIW